MDLKDQILSKVRLEDVVERYFPLNRRNSPGKTLVGLCPFHADRHPSFYVNKKDQYYKCFACGEGGDLFKFVQKMEGCDFPQALKILAGWYGLSDSEEILPAFRRKELKHNQEKPVVKDLPSQEQIDYLLRSHQSVLHMLKSYVPEDNRLQEIYKLFEVGIAPTSFPHDYTGLRNRVVFPIRNEQGQLVAFAGRYQGETKGTDIRKYVNSSNSAVYRKGELLYGLYQAREHIALHGFVYLVEGYKDVLAMYAAGFCNTVALCGTALTDPQIALLGRYTRHVVVMLDGDAAGKINGVKAVRSLARKEFSASLVILDPRHDPDSLLRELGYECFVNYLKRVTRFSRLEAYEVSLLKQLEQKLSALKLALTIDERKDLFSHMITLHKRLAKVTGRLSHCPVLRTNWLLGIE